MVLEDPETTTRGPNLPSLSSLKVLISASRASILVVFGDLFLLGRDLFLDGSDLGSGRSLYAARHG